MPKGRKRRKSKSKHDEFGKIDQESPMTVQLTPDRRNFTRRRITNLLQEAERLVYHDRNKAYKHPMQNFTNISNLWNAYLGAMGRSHDLPISHLDVAAMNVLQKIARISTNQQHFDSWLDIAGYAACAERILKNQ